MLKPVLVLFSFLAFLHGCTYAISPNVASKADRTILFEKLQADPDAYKGKLVILGGSILQITPLRKGTLIEVAQRRLDYWGKPERTARTGGRFFVFYPGFLDPMVYSTGRDITMAGEVSGLSSPVLGDKQYDYPVILSKELKLWERDRQTWDKPTWIDPLYDQDSPERKQ